MVLRSSLKDEEFGEDIPEVFERVEDRGLLGDMMGFTEGAL
jgi:hypothetical protein